MSTFTVKGRQAQMKLHSTCLSLCYVAPYLALEKEKMGGIAQTWNSYFYICLLFINHFNYSYFINTDELKIFEPRTSSYNSHAPQFYQECAQQIR